MGGQVVRWVEEATVSTLRQPLCGVFLTPPQGKPLMDFASCGYAEARGLCSTLDWSQ